MNFDEIIEQTLQGLTREEVVERLAKEENRLEQEILDIRGELRLKGHAIKAKEQEIEDSALELDIMEEEFNIMTTALLDMLDEQYSTIMMKAKEL